MTLAELALVVGVPPKTLLNAAAVLETPARYTLPLARRLAVALAIQQEAGVPLPRAWDMAAEALRRFGTAGGVVTVTGDPAAVVAVQVDVYRILAAVNVRLAQLRTMYAPRRRGRRAEPVDPLVRATAHGLDLSLLRANLRRSPKQRLAQLDAMQDFRRRVRRVHSSPAEA